MPTLEDRFLTWLKPPAEVVARPYRPRGGETTSMLARHFGAPLWAAIYGRIVLDYGCGDGADAIELARQGAKQVIGLEVDPRPLGRARARADAAGVGDRCHFTTETDVIADIVVSSDTFEHVWDLAVTLRDIHRRLAPDGQVWASFGPPWYHPKGGHPFAVFPWAHLLLTEAALCRWRSASSPFPVRCFTDAGLNKMTVRRFLQIVGESDFAVEAFACLPIRRLRRLGLERWPLIREFVTSVVVCRLRRKPSLNRSFPGGRV